MKLTLRKAHATRYQPLSTVEGPFLLLAAVMLRKSTTFREWQIILCNSQVLGVLSIQPKIPEILVGKSNGTDHFGLVRPEYSGPALKVVLPDWSGHFGRSENVPFHLTNCCPQYRSFVSITKRAVAWVGSLQPECTVPLGTWNLRNFKSEFLLKGKRPWFKTTGTYFTRVIFFKTNIPGHVSCLICKFLLSCSNAYLTPSSATTNYFLWTLFLQLLIHLRN